MQIEKTREAGKRRPSAMSSENTTSKYPFAVIPYEYDDFVGYRAFLIDIPAVESLGATQFFP